ncbi:trypsin [Dictyocaulus viviparus]|uniref:Trypsin n=1 Tax=Dictyocaulus viviparus TaxID=29172 RepID=A0A0D8Y4K4_DICVI|nr:trypsin [Dictyocaulus viviparus]
MCGGIFLLQNVVKNISAVIGGARVQDHEYAWTPGLKASSKTSAVLVSTRHILTAAALLLSKEIAEQKTRSVNYSKHKPMQTSQLYVYPETRVKDLRNIPKLTSSFRVMTIHKDFNPCNNSRDIALLGISTNMLTEAVPICMPHVNETVPDNLTATGFGMNRMGDSGGQIFKVNDTEYTLLGISSKGDKCEMDQEDKIALFEDVRSKIGWICHNSGICPL